MQAQADILSVAGIAMLSAIIALLALRLRSARRASKIDQGRAAAILKAAVDGIITIDEDGLIEKLQSRLRTPVRLPCRRGPGPDCPVADAGTLSLRA